MRNNTHATPLGKDMSDKLTELQITMAKLETRLSVADDNMAELTTAVKDLTQVVVDLRGKYEQNQAVLRFIKWLASISFFAWLFKTLGIKLLM